MGKKSGLAAVATVLGTAGCIPAMDEGYSGYGYGYTPGYYSQPTYYSTYTPSPTVITETRYVVVPSHHHHHHHSNRRR